MSEFFQPMANFFILLLIIWHLWEVEVRRASGMEVLLSCCPNFVITTSPSRLVVCYSMLENNEIPRKILQLQKQQPVLETLQTVKLVVLRNTCVFQLSWLFGICEKVKRIVLLVCCLIGSTSLLPRNLRPPSFVNMSDMVKFHYYWKSQISLYS